jgi:hypothetical protein
MKSRHILLTAVLLVLSFLALLPEAKGVVPAPDGGYPGQNTAEGQAALFSLTTGINNAAVGFSSLRSNTTGGYNTAIGAGALFANTADKNTATGFGALLSNSTGSLNMANGAVALLSNTTGFANTASGFQALHSNTTGFSNSATGTSALKSNITGSHNTAQGLQALYFNTSGDNNTANGVNALYYNTTGDSNTADGIQALLHNTTGHENTATGSLTLLNNTSGFQNTAIGYEALISNTTGNYNIAVGVFAGQNHTTGDNNIYIGNIGLGVESNTIRVGSSHTATYIMGIHGETASSGTPVIINASGKLGTTASSQRFKKDIATMKNASEAILSLRPVTFHYKTDATGTPQFGLIAEEVAKVNPALVLPDKEGKPYTVRYEAVNAMLLNEFLKAHRKIEEQEETISQLKQDFRATAAHQQKQIETLASSLQKVRTQLEMRKPAPRIVVNNH